MTPAGFRMAMYKYTCYMYMSSSTCRYCQGIYTYYTSIYCIVAGFSDPINISHVTGHVYICTSVHSESVYSHIRLNRMWLLNRVRYNVWREGEKLPFPVWREVWNGVQLQVWHLVEWTGMETTSTHNLPFSEIVSQYQLYLLYRLRGRASVEFPGEGRWQYRTLCLGMEEVVPVIYITSTASIHWEKQLLNLCPHL